MVPTLFERPAKMERTSQQNSQNEITEICYWKADNKGDSLHEQMGKNKFANK